MRTGSWNFLSLYKPGGPKNATTAVTYKVHTTAIQEMRWTGKGIMKKKDHYIFYSCQKKDHDLNRFYYK
jgi:hypothetical protein